MDQNKSLVCDNCGGTDFTKDSGYYFCTECQTQSQDIQETVFEHNDTVPILEKKVKIREEKSDKATTKHTSWEVYNYVVYGLVGELENLGADDKFKEITYHLWMKYLTKLEIIFENENKPPKLSVVYKKRDAEIVYKKKFRRKRKQNVAGNLSVGDMDDRMKYAEKRKHRKIMEKKEYDTISTTQQSESQSIANQTLSGLSTDEESSLPGHISYNKQSIKQLLRHMTYNHLQKHMTDVKNEMTCHKINRKFISQMYLRGPEVLTRNKLYCLLYLSLLLSEQDLQLSDIVRYCREGHLSFMDYEHFFPDEINDKAVDSTIYSGGQKIFPSFEFFKTFTFKLYRYLELRPCDFSPNILKLCRRYCTELNLPDEIYNAVGDFIFNTRPFQNITDPKCISNYEGRAMGFIIYILKVLLGFDDVTEYELGKFAQMVNKKNSEGQKTLFNFSDWFSYIEYRKTVLKYVHFPTWQLLHPDVDCPLDLYVKHVYSKKDIYEKEPKDLTMNIAKKFLTDIEVSQVGSSDSSELIVFEPSLTPFRSYINHLKTIENFTVLGHTLNVDLIRDRSQESIEYLISPKPYLKIINAEKCSIIFNNAHQNHKFQRINPHIGEFFQNTYQHWEEKWNSDFSRQKSEQLSLDILMNKILDKHIDNVETGSKVETEFLPALRDNNLEKVKKSVGRNARGRFCKKSDKDALPPEEITPVKRGRWHVSSWNNTKLINEPSLLKQVEKDEENRQENPQKTSKTKNLNPPDKYKYHYIPRMEYCSNIRDTTNMTKQKYKEFESTLPKNFQWLLKECARILEQPTKDVFQEFVHVEVYMNYVYLKKQPVISKPLSNNAAINKMIKNVVKIW